MDIDFVNLMTTKSDESLQAYIDQRRKYNPAAVFAAINEFKKRGKTFTDIEIEQIKSELEDERKKSIKRIDESDLNDNFDLFDYIDPVRPKSNSQGDNYSPNHIPTGERIKCLIFSIGLIVYGSIGVYIDDLYVPGKHSRGLHFHGIPCWVMYFAFLFASITLISVVIDHYDKRNNETNYQKFTLVTRRIGWTLFLIAIISDLFVYHQATKH